MNNVKVGDVVKLKCDKSETYIVHRADPDENHIVCNRQGGLVLYRLYNGTYDKVGDSGILQDRGR